MQDVIDILDDREFWTVRAFLEEAIKRKRGGMALRMGAFMTTIIAQHNQANEYGCRAPDSGAYDDACERYGFRNFVEGYEAGMKDRGFK